MMTWTPTVQSTWTTIQPTVNTTSTTTSWNYNYDYSTTAIEWPYSNSNNHVISYHIKEDISEFYKIEESLNTDVCRTIVNDIDLKLLSMFIESNYYYPEDFFIEAKENIIDIIKEIIENYSLSISSWFMMTETIDYEAYTEFLLLYYAENNFLNEMYEMKEAMND